MTSTTRCPMWPLPHGEKIGIDRARAVMAWLKENAPSVVAEAQKELVRLTQGTQPGAGAYKLGQIAEITMNSDTLYIGSAWVTIKSGTWAMMNIVVNASGFLEARPGWNVPVELLS